MQNSLRFRLILILIILAIGPLLLVGAILAERSFSFEQAQAYDLQNQVARNISTEVETVILGINNDLATLGNEIRSLENPDQAQQLSLMLRTISSGAYSDFYDELALLDQNGYEVIRLSSQEIVPNSDLTDRSSQNEFTEPVNSRTTYYSPPSIDQNTGKAYITLAIPLYLSRSTTLSGVLVAKIRLDIIGNTIARVQVGENQTVYLTDESGKVLAHQDRTFDIRDKQIQLPKTATTQNGILNENVVISSDRIQLGNESIYIVAEKPVRAALEIAYTTITTISVVTLIALIAAAILGFFAVRQIVVPIEGLASVAENIAKGDLTQKASINRSDEIGVLAYAFDSMTSQLRDLIGNLEKRVENRTADLASANQRNEKRARQFEAVAQVARATTANENIDTLLPRLTSLISDNFGFYHTGIFLLDDDRTNAVLRATNSEGGKKMLARGHRLQVGQVGIVGFVSAKGTPRIALDVGTDAVFFDNPDLPNTRSEMALPLRVAGEVVGVLDVQSTEPNAFQQEDIDILSTLADQVSIAMQNSQSFETMQQHLQEAQRTSSTLLGDAWHDIQQSEDTHIGYRAFGEEFQAYNKPLTSEHIQKAVEAKQTVIENGKRATLAVPIRLHDEVIGIVDIKTPAEHEWEDDEVDIAEAVAERLSLAIETSLLLRSTKRRAEFERVTAEISGKLGATTQFDAILRTAAEELSQILGGSDVLVQIQPEKWLNQENA